MNLYISFLEDAGVRFPPDKIRDQLVDAVRDALSDLEFSDFDRLGIYMHLPGPDNTFGMEPGVKLRLNRRAEYMRRTGPTWDGKLAAIVEGVVLTLEALLRRYRRLDEFPLYESVLVNL